MQRKQGFPVANCNIKLPDNMLGTETVLLDDDGEQLQRRQQLINFAHAQWGFNNWSWSVSKQDLDFVDFSNGKYCAGVVAFVSVTVKTFDIHRENIGYATSVAHNKGLAIWKSRKSAVTNALRETLLSFGGNVATELLEVLESTKSEVNHPPTVSAAAPVADPPAECSAIKAVEPKNKHLRKEAETGLRPPPKAPLAANLPPANRPPVANAPRPPGPPGPPGPAPVPLARPNSNDAGAAAGAGEAGDEEAARAERKRRQRAAQEEFRRQMTKQTNKSGDDEIQDLPKSNNSFDNLLRELPTQDIVIEESGSATDNGCGEAAKRRSPTASASDTAAKRRTSLINRLDIVMN